MVKQRLLGISSLLLLFSGFAFISWLYKPTLDTVEQARITCGDTVWVTESDSLFHHVFEKSLNDKQSLQYLQSPLPKNESRTLTCSKSAADNIVNFEVILRFASYFLLLPLWLPLLLISMATMWLYNELKLKGRKKN